MVEITRGRVREKQRDGLAAAHVGAQGLGQMNGRREVELLHHRHKTRAIALLQPGIGAHFLGDRGVTAPLVVMGGIDLRFSRQFQHDIEQAVEKLVRIARR